MNDGRRDYPDRPWVGVGVVIWRGGEVLLARRGRPPRQGEWSIPGGAQQVGETVAQAAAREALEETGLVVRPAELVAVEDAVTRDAEGAVQYHYVIVELAANWISGEAQADDDATEVRWADPIEACRLLAANPAAVRVLRKAAALRGFGDGFTSLE
ncbi:MAG TPA: NUDIX hydrolase [Azospirillaceae bacterium]|nr:NUDIX hydrolase [Azospirillaceae bacterium]HRQ80829.1 NUDIX hydrolase [Azospirillaceae bacterium]